MNLIAKPVHYKMKEYAEIVKLLRSAFPSNEQIPIWILQLLALRKSTKFTAFYDEDAFAGVMYSAENSKYFFILYLAVNPQSRSKGYGGAILEYAYKIADRKNIVLNVEALEADSTNYQQRQRRVTFYGKHGICDTGYSFADDGVTYSVLASDPESFDPNGFERLLKEFSIGFYRRKIAKR